MLPIGDDDSDRRIAPLVNYALIAMNVLVFVAFQGAGSNEHFTYAFSTVPEEITKGHDIATGILQPTPIPVYGTLITSMFMHGGWAHLLGNMLYLWIFGDNVEDRLGHAKYLVFYLLCGIAATFAQVLVNTTSNVPNLGASGAIAGVLGAYLLMFPRGSVRVLMGRGIIPMPAIVVIGFWAVLHFLSGFGAIATTE